MKRTLALLLSVAPAGAGQDPALGSPPEPAERGFQARASLSLERALDVTAEGRAFVELTSVREAYYVHEPIRVRLRFGVETRFLEDSLIQPFQRQLDVPVLLEAPWLEDLPGTLVLESEPLEPYGDRPWASFALGERIAEAQCGGESRAGGEAAGGRRFAVLELERNLLATSPGELAIPGAILRFAFATRFEEDFVRGRVAADRTDAYVRGEGLALAIRPLPEEGRPLAFTGAVGSFSIEAEASPRELAAGESLKLVLRIEGQGNLEFFEAPRLDALVGFRLYGQVEERSRTRRIVTYHLSPVSERVRDVPSIAFAYFDPTPPAGYSTLYTKPIALAVRPRAAGARAGVEGDDADARAAPAPTRDGAERERSKVALLAAILVPAVTALALALAVRSRARRKAPASKA